MKGMKHPLVILHAAKCAICEAALRMQTDIEITRVKRRVERDVAILRARLADERRLLVPQTGMARRLANLTYPIEQARQQALAKFHADKRRAMAELAALISSGRDHSLRELAVLLGVSYMTVSRYRRELVSAGFAPA